MTILLLDRDVSGAITYALQDADLKAGAQLAQNVAQTLITLPNENSIYEVFFSYSPGATVFVNVKGVASAFGAASQVDSELNPMGRVYPRNTVISVITPDEDGAYVGIIVYVKG